jgi:predicted GNAT family acetyltransferase
MKVERLASPQDFLARTADFRAAEPVFTNMHGSIAAGVAAGRVYEQEFWWVVVDGAGSDQKVVGCALRTAPYRLIVSPMPAQGAHALGRAVAAADPALPGCNGPREVVEAALAGYDKGRDHRVTMTDVVYVLTDYLPPRPVAGGPRLAVRDDLDLLVAWHHQFGVDVGLPMHDVPASVGDRIAHGGLWLWEVNGTPVAMAGHAPVVDTPAGAVGRIGPVYTVAEQRGRGYGSAVTAAVVDALAPQCSTLMLFADAANPTSNGIYLALGFSPVGELVEAELG